MQVSRVCRICEKETGRVYTIHVSMNHAAREWRMKTCRSCWRTLEGLLDAGADGVQQGLARPFDLGSEPMFLW